MVIAILKHVPEPNFKQSLAGIEPYSETTCMVCKGNLAEGVPARCMDCGVKHLPLKS